MTAIPKNTIFDETALPPEVSSTLDKMNKDLKKTANDLSRSSARLIVDRYYQVQRDRIRAEHQARMAAEAGEGNELLDFFAAQARVLEHQLQVSLDVYSYNHPVGRWARSNKGIGPVLAAGLLAHIDIEKCPTAGHIWSFAGLSPDKEWKKGEKRPWNTNLKTLCAYKVGEAFVKVSGYEDAYYGKLYKQQKANYIERNEQGLFAQRAQMILDTKKLGEDTIARQFYQKGMLPPAHIHAMARRWTVKIFLSHLHEVWYWHHYKEAPPKPFAMAVLGHAHEIKPPNWTPPVQGPVSNLDL